MGNKKEEMNPEKELELAKGAFELMVESSKDTNEVVKDAIINLLRARDFLGHQLSHAFGFITDVDLDVIAEKYCYPNEKTIHELKHRATTLLHILGDKLDLDNLSIMLGCSLDEARTTLALIKNTEKQNGK